DVGEITYLYDYIREYNSTGGIVWELSSSTFQTTGMWCPYGDSINGDPDLSHSNTIFFDVDEDMIYYNSRNTNTFYKIDHSTSTVVWALGEYGDFTLYDLKGNVKDELFYHAHAIEKIGDNKFLLFDNDYHNQTNSTSKISRLVEITIDENTMTANETWTWEAPGTYYSGYWGDADPLPNGNIFGTFGTFEHGGYLSIGARMIEVNPEGDIVWEINFPMASYRYGIYRAERFGFSPFINASSEVFAGSGTDVSATFQTWYNFRSKTKITGSYELYLDESSIDTGPVQFDEFWRTKNLTFDLGILPDGQHNLTIVIADEAGHASVKTMFINIGPFFIERTGPTEMEVGEPDSIISWSGYAVTPLEFNLTINGTHEFNVTWSGEVAQYDLNALAVGIHNFTVQLFNGTDLVFNETFWITIFPNSPPVFESFPSDQAITWSEILMLSWNVTDSSLYKIDLYLNGDIDSQIEFLTSPASYIFDYVFPLVDEGDYNITLVVTDRTFGSVSKTTWIEVTSPSPPIISQVPMNDLVLWGQENTSFLWEVHGETDSSWVLIKNGTTYTSGVLSDKIIELSIDDWYNIEWYPGTYNLTLYVEDTYGNSTSASVFITIALAGDPYADEFLETASLYFTYGTRAVGAPDGRNAEISTDYSNGYITLDMGFSEEITNEAGDDFTVISTTGEYTCWVSNSLSEAFIIIGTGEGNS
ncbi:MAG: aryl-sulfate sulfotransferase, partial [Candidatus Heimdallarchaeaceae archaeon]